MTRIDRQTAGRADTAALIRLARYLGIPPKNTREELEDAIVRYLDLVDVFPQFAQRHEQYRQRKW